LGKSQVEFGLTTRQIDCSSSKEGIANLRRKHQTLIDAGVDLDKANTWLESEDELLAEMPWFTKEHVKVKCLEDFERSRLTD
jgi:hypothetical protein